MACCLTTWGGGSGQPCFCQFRRVSLFCRSMDCACRQSKKLWGTSGLMIFFSCAFMRTKVWLMEKGCKFGEAAAWGILSRETSKTVEDLSSVFEGFARQRGKPMIPTQKRISSTLARLRGGCTRNLRQFHTRVTCPKARIEAPHIAASSGLKLALGSSTRADKPKPPPVKYVRCRKRRQWSRLK